MGFTEKTLDDKFKGHNLLLYGSIYEKKGRLIIWKRSCFSTELLLLFRSQKISHIHIFCKNMKMLLYMKGVMHGSLGLRREAIIPTCC